MRLRPYIIIWIDIRARLHLKERLIFCFGLFGFSISEDVDKEKLSGKKIVKKLIILTNPQTFF